MTRIKILASELGVSRASLARRFHERVGEPPMTETVSTVAEKVGYATPFAFSAAFKRVRGISPQKHRASALQHITLPNSASTQVDLETRADESGDDRG